MVSVPKSRLEDLRLIVATAVVCGALACAPGVEDAGQPPGEPADSPSIPLARAPVDAGAGSQRGLPDAAAVDAGRGGEAAPDAPPAPRASDAAIARDGLAAVDAAPPGAGVHPVFDTSVLHVVQITVDPKYLTQLDRDQETRVPAAMVWDGITLMQVGLRKKGSLGSLSPITDKPALSVKFDSFLPNQRLYNLKKLLLNNAKQDPSFLSEHLGYEISRRAGLPAALTSHAVLTFNGEVYGIYVVKEAIDGEFLERNFGKSYDKGNLYEGDCKKDPCTNYDFVTFPQNLELKDEVEEMRSRDDLRRLADVALNAKDADWAAALGKLFDLDRYIVHFAVEALAAHWDGYAFMPNNYYLYDNPRDGRFVMMPHGMDALFGDLNRSVTTTPVGRAAQRVRRIPALDTRFRAEIQRVLREAWDVPALHKRIDGAATVIRSAKDKATGDKLKRDLTSFEANHQRVRDFISQRKARLLTP